MSTTETIVVCVALAAATVAAVLGALTPTLAGIIGVALGYGGKGVSSTGVFAKLAKSPESENWKAGP